MKASKPSIDDGRDDQGNPLEVGALYAVYQTLETPGAGVLAYYTDTAEWADADDVEKVIDLSGEFCHGTYDFACKQS